MADGMEEETMKESKSLNRAKRYNFCIAFGCILTIQQLRRASHQQQHNNDLSNINIGLLGVQGMLSSSLISKNSCRHCRFGMYRGDRRHSFCCEPRMHFSRPTSDDDGDIIDRVGILPKLDESFVPYLPPIASADFSNILSEMSDVDFLQRENPTSLTNEDPSMIDTEPSMYEVDILVSEVVDYSDSSVTVKTDLKEESEESKEQQQEEELATTAAMAPSLAKILSFAIPAIGVWLCNPLLSVIDTSTVGMLSGTIQQGALSPAVTITDYSARILSFLYVGTTNSVATSKEADHHRRDGVPQTTQTLIGALQLSLWVGMALSAVLFIFAKRLLRILIGNDSLDAAVLSTAVKYVRIRALGMPAAAVIGSAQAACLGLQDIRSPLNVIVTAAVVNFFCDLLLVGNPHPFIGGAAGAAWATIFSQYVAMSMFLKWLFDANTNQDPSQRRQSFLTKVWSPKTMQQQQPVEASTRGFLTGRCMPRDLLRYPAPGTVQRFTQYFLPVTTTMIGRTSAYIAMNHVVSSCFGTLSMAAHQIMVSIFYALVPISDSLSLTAQSFIPGICQMSDPRQRARALQTTTLNFLKAAGLFGLTLAGIVACIPATCGKLFSSDPAVVSLVNSLVPIQFIYFALHGIFCASEGILLGQKDLTFLGRMYAVFFAIVPWMMLRLKAAAQVGNASLITVWRVLLGYQLVRILTWVGRVTWLQIKAVNKAKSH